MTDDSAARDDTDDAAARTPSEDPADASGEVDTGSTDAPESVADANRRRFREALDRKRSGHHGEGASADPKARSPHASPAKPQRTFRRKSG